MKRIVWMLFLTLAITPMMARTTKLAHAADRVLVVHSYHADYDWTRDVNTAIENSLSGSSIELQTFFMDTKRNPSKEWKIASGRKAKKVLAQFKPKVVITVDDNAQAFFASEYIGKSDIQFIFCGVNADPEKYGYPAPNVTGILERSYPVQVLRLLKTISPFISGVAYVSDDSATGNGVLPRIRDLAQKNKLPLPILSYSQPSFFSQWQNTIKELERDPHVGAIIIPLYHTVKIDGTDKSMPPAKIMEWTTQHTSKPIVGFWPFSTDDGALSAVVVDPKEHGRVAALMAKQILAGKHARELTIVTNKDGFVIVNLKTAARLAIEVPFDVLQSADKIIE